MRYRVGIVGTGRVARLHVQGYRGTGRTELVAAADISAEAREAFAKEFEVGHVYTDYRRMLEAEHLDIVSICTWPHLHREAVLAAAETPGVRGILCEKPLALALADMQEMIAACDHAGIRFAVGHQLRYQRRHERACELIRSGALGEAERIWAVCSSGDLLSNAIHTVDLMLMYAGDRQVTDLLAQVDPGEGAYRFGHPVERTALAYGCLASAGQQPATRFVLESANPWSKGYHHLVVEGSAGRLEVNNPDGPSLRVWRAGLLGWATVEIPDEPDPSVGAALELCRAIEEGRDPRSSGRTGYRSAEVIFGVYASAVARAPVRLPLAPDAPNPLRALFGWDGVPRGGRGTVYSTDGTVAAGKIT